MTDTTADIDELTELQRRFVEEMLLDPMRILGILLVVLGILALAVPTISFMTTERAVDAGFFKIDYQKPHTLVLNPIVGIVATIAGIAMLFASRRTEAA